jgi:hypothetical protein
MNNGGIPVKQNRFYPLLTLSAIFLLTSLVLLSVLGYNFYQQSKSKRAGIIQPVKPSAAVPAITPTRDSLQKVYSATINSFSPDTLTNTPAPADTAGIRLMDQRLTDYYRLKNEINSLLRDSSSVADLQLAMQKIRQLQQRVMELSSRNTDMEKENRRLRSLLEQLTAAGNDGGRSAEEPATARVPATSFSSSDAVFTASELRLSAADENNTEVNSADIADRFIGSLMVRNSLIQGNAELMLVLIQPDGRVLRSAWESGSFDTDAGRRIYSRKIRFDYSKGEQRRLEFMLPVDNCQKGNYTLQVYSRGRLIGKASKMIS